MLTRVEGGEARYAALHLGRERETLALLEGPGSGRKNLGAEVQVEGFWIGQVPPELLVEVLGDADVLEHSLELGGVLEPAGLLQFWDHGSLGVVAGGHVLHQTLSQHFTVEFLENIFVFDVFEHNHNLKTNNQQLKTNALIFFLILYTNNKVLNFKRSKPPDNYTKTYHFNIEKLISNEYFYKKVEQTLNYSYIGITLQNNSLKVSSRKN